MWVIRNREMRKCANGLSGHSDRLATAELAWRLPLKAENLEVAWLKFLDFISVCDKYIHS